MRNSIQRGLFFNCKVAVIFDKSIWLVSYELDRTIHGDHDYDNLPEILGDINLGDTKNDEPGFYECVIYTTGGSDFNGECIEYWTDFEIRDLKKIA